jgi:4-amino-4-deoxy-L-arabinose transferase-like glycosyltransferase
LPSQNPEQNDIVPSAPSLAAARDDASGPEPADPGAQTAPTPPTRRFSLAGGLATAIVIAAWIVLELWGLGAAPFHTKGEPREALVVWEMTHGGGWILPKRNGTELPSKPPLFHWLGALTSLARGSTDEWSIRFPSAALSLLGVLGAFVTAAALWTPAAGRAAALSLMTTFEWARAATSARVDMTLTAGLEAAFVGFLFFLRTRRSLWLVVFYAGMAVGALGKGPVGIVLPAVLALLTIVATRDATLVRQMRLLRGGIAVLIIAGSWYLLALQVGGDDFLHKQLLNENLLRFVGGSQFSGGHRHSNLTFLGLVLLGLMPWALLLPFLGSALWKRRRHLSFRGGELYCVAWIAVVCAFYAFATSKRSVYLLAIHPAIALLIGWWWAQLTASTVRWRSAALSVVGITTAALVTLVFAAVLLHVSGLPLLDWIAATLSVRDRANVLSVARGLTTEPRLPLACLGAAAAALLAFGIGCRRGHPPLAYGSLFSAAAALIILVRLSILPAIAGQETLRDFMREAKAAAGPADATFFYRTFDYGAVFYSQGHIPTHDGTFPRGAPRFLLTSRTEWERLRARAVNDYEQVPLPSDPRRLVLIRRLKE